ncbi:MAG: LUD domain-containing protein [Chloroflexi bacterium]|nr:LUD domain-containing protein [Chloroflexota bacterium]
MGSSRRALVLAALAGVAAVAVKAAIDEPRRRRFARGAADFRQRYERALASEQLRKNLIYYQRTWRRQRDTAFADYLGDSEDVGRRPGEPPETSARAHGDRAHGDRAHGELTPDVQLAAAAAVDVDRDFESMRRRLAKVKNEVLSDLPHYVERFRENAVRAGAVVYQARDAEDANRYVADLAYRRGARLVVKSKSMVTEETHLNHTLEEFGLRVVETDFGEWIAQLAHERPSHMISPIAHKNRYEVGEVLTPVAGRPVSGENIPELAAIARAKLREEFLAGQLGISGANALVADNGAVMLVTNEGNAELISSLPDTHVVICGSEKIVPTMADAVAQVRLLGRSGTGQGITVYTTFVAGPDRPGREVHIVLLDNGRSEMKSEDDFVDVLRCIRCGACANVCPPYQVVGGHVFGYIYTGAVGLVTTPFHHGTENAAGPQSLCVSCNACATVCPVAIPLPRQILDVRRKVVAEAGLPWYKRATLAIWERPALFDAAARLGSKLQLPFTSDGLLGRLPLPESLAWRTPPALASQPARDRLVGRTFDPTPNSPLGESGAKGLTVAYFIQCLTDRVTPEMADATVAVLRAAGARVVVPEGQHCCGLPAHDSGDRATAVRMAQQTIEALEAAEADYVVTAAASCAIAILHDYEHILADLPGWSRRAKRLAERTLDFVTFLDRVARLPSGALAQGPAYAVTYHNFCQSNNVLGLYSEPRRIIREVLGLELRELEEAAVCCGFGGSFSIDHPRVSRHIVGRKLENVDATGARVLVTDNPGCIIHLRGAIHASGRDLLVLHLAELIAERLRETTGEHEGG